MEVQNKQTKKKKQIPYELDIVQKVQSVIPSDVANWDHLSYWSLQKR